jgi:hypothetical protein
MRLDEQKTSVLRDLCRDRVVCRALLGFQIAWAAVVSAILAWVAFECVKIAITISWERADSEILGKVLSALASGSSSLPGIVVLKLLAKVTELSRALMLEEKKFTAIFAKVRLAKESELSAIMDEYESSPTYRRGALPSACCDPPRQRS